jgi:eukaryotic-like serine/threonine-protein kinase
MSEQSLFIAALERNPSERGAFLDSVCAGNANLRGRVEKLLLAHEHAANFMAEPAAPHAATIDEPVTERTGTIIGPYKLMEQIGEGGMGLVFVADQQRPVRRKLALKVIKPGMDTRQVIARFEAERQALALMDHPNIAKVHDGGETVSGRPYFVMELVKGVPITEYCDQNQVPIRDRLELFLDACAAVQHAHQKGIIHRDIKPTNVLVMSNDGTPLVKVIDFGVAKAIGQQLTDKTIYTQFTQLVGTPLYMSPEQAGQSSVDVDTRTDIYGLGVLLYELLTGTTPFDKERLHGAGYDEIRRIIREEEPPKPSTRISTLGQGATTVTTQRKSDPRQLSRLVRGELDWIVMKALEKDRNRRYETASSFAADVQRYLQDEPVQACPPSVWYRYRKFVRRNKRVLTSVVATTASILVGLAVTVVLLAKHTVEMKAEHEHTRKEYDRAEKALGQAKANLERADRNLALALEALDDVYMKDVEDRILRDRHITEAERASLQKGLQFYERFAQENSGHAELRRATAKAHRRAGYLRLEFKDYAVARADFAQAIAAFEQWADESHGSAEDQEELARSCHGMTATFGSASQHREGLPICRRAVALLRKLSADHPEVMNHRVELAHCLWELSGVLWSDDQPGQAEEEAVREALRLFEALSAENPEERFYRQELGYSHRLLAGILRRTGRSRQATESLQKSVLTYAAIATDAPGNSFYRQELAFGYYRLARSLRESGRAREAHEASSQAFANWAKAIELDPKNPGARRWRGEAYYESHQYDKAIADFSKAIEFDPTAAANHTSLGNALKAQGRLDEAIAEYRVAIRLEKDDPSPYNNLAWLLATCPEPKFRDPKRAVELANNAVKLAPKVGNNWNTLGVATYRAGSWQKAVTALEKSLKLQGDNGFDGFFLAMAHWQLGEKDTARQRFDEAVQWMEKNQPRNDELCRFRAEAVELLGIKEGKK